MGRTPSDRMASCGWPGPAPSYPYLSSERGHSGPPWALRSATRTRTRECHADPEPRAWAFPGTWPGNTAGGSHRCAALMLGQALRGLRARLPVSLGPHQSPKQRNWHMVRFTDEETRLRGQAQGAGAEPAFQCRSLCPRAQAPDQHTRPCPSVQKNNIRA